MNSDNVKKESSYFVQTSFVEEYIFQANLRHNSQEKIAELRFCLTFMYAFMSKEKAYIQVKHPL